MRERTGDTVVVIGAGMGGISAAILLAAQGLKVQMIEAAAAPGGKMRRVTAGGHAFDAGPTVLTMKWVFDEILAHCGTSLAEEIPLTRSDVIARHYWRNGERLDLFADVAESRRAIADFAGAREAQGFQRFADDSARIYHLLERSFIDAARPNPLSLSARIGLNRPHALMALKPFATLWSALSDYFADPRLSQLFGRYATYCGSSPFLSPATLMLVAHVEQAGVWTIEGGMHALARRLMDIACDFGVEIHYGERVSSILSDGSGRKVAGVLTDRERCIAADSVLYNGDVAALGPLLGRPAAAERRSPRSLSALVTCGLERPLGVPLAHHTVFFSDDYRAEFYDIFDKVRPPRDPTVYLCAQDRLASGARSVGQDERAPERLYCLMNMPADGDSHAPAESEIEQCLSSMRHRLEKNGLTISLDRAMLDVTTPESFDRLYPGSGGALYGVASHGWMASFQRPGARGPLKGLYLAGGSVHPGPGVPMAALSGKIAAQRLIADRASNGRSRLAAITGGMRMRSAIADLSP
ncbi:1-hydroxycarotenoid 3,4-desaturase CrtD [Rhizobium sp. G21]|uniref:1-hydroxycarotenoid 3,4-desaturase CrtD n=1 Tax=Rhizobium sp. G21 TaxID=2758439 RepID=UPI00160239C7|nr:1-hydroxycarotenoid 3,4-desaturase CrtD [Rhizobium sp. G21]MBB1251233.1 phytoene desaturase [Rhizobium sp. G21]